MITLKYYEVGDCYDAEGRGPWECIGRFVNITDANKFALKKGNYGKNADVRPVDLNVAESIEEHDIATELKAAQKVLAVLTPAQRAALTKHYGLRV